MLKNYKALKVWEKAYKLFLDIYTVTKCFPKKEIYGLTSQIKRGARGCRENAKSDDQITGKQTLESLNPRLLEPFLPTNWEKIQLVI